MGFFRHIVASLSALYNGKMGWGTFRLYAFCISMSFLTACLKTSTEVSGFTYTLSQFVPAQGYGMDSQTFRVTGTNLKTTDTLKVNGVTCVVDVASTTSTLYVCQLPALCSSAPSCSVVGQSLSVVYTQSGQVLRFPTGFFVPSYEAMNLNLITDIGVYSQSFSDLQSRYLSRAGGQVIYFGFTSVFTGSLSAIKIGENEEIDCGSIQADSVRGGNFYRCTTSALATGTMLGSGLKRIKFYFSDGSVAQFIRAFWINDGTLTTDSNGIASTSVSVTETLSSLCAGSSYDLIGAGTWTNYSTVSPQCATYIDGLF